MGKTKDDTERITFRVKEVETMTGIPASTVRRRIRSGDLKASQGFGIWLIEKKELDRFLEETAVGGKNTQK